MVKCGCRWGESGYEGGRNGRAKEKFQGEERGWEKRTWPRSLRGRAALGRIRRPPLAHNSAGDLLLARLSSLLDPNTRLSSRNANAALRPGGVCMSDVGAAEPLKQDGETILILLRGRPLQQAAVRGTGGAPAVQRAAKAGHTNYAF